MLKEGLKQSFNEKERIVFVIKSKALIVVLLLIFIIYCNNDSMTTGRKIVKLEENISAYKAEAQKISLDSIKYPASHAEIEKKEYFMEILNDYEQLVSDLINNLKRRQIEDIGFAVLSIIITLIPILFQKINSRYVGIIGIFLIVALLMLISITLLLSGNNLADSRLLIFSLLCIFGFQMLAKKCN